MRELDPKWTKAQRDAIRSRGETLLVSAAAGSGKTAVLTERIIDRLLEEDNALDLSSVLVVTFTKAAAAELKTRIRAALDREIAKNPDNKRLQTQLFEVNRAKICTIDSFCLDLIRAHFDTLGLSPRVSVSDEASANLLCKNVMNDLIDDYFDGRITDEEEQIPDFGAFSDLFVTARTSSALADVLLAIRETVNGYEEGTAWFFLQKERLLSAAGDDIAGDFLYSDVGRVLCDALLAFAENFTAEYAELCAFLASDAVYLKNYGDCFSYERVWCEELLAILKTKGNGRWDTLRAHFDTFNAPGLKSGIRGDKKTDDVLRAKARHEAFNEARKEFAEKFFTVSETELAELNREQAAVAGHLGTFFTVYERRLAVEKNRRKTLDFGDMGRLALKLLWDAEKGCPTDVAWAEAQKYSEIYIDEYQDVSPVQDRIFSSIARKNNRFMVGDAKQSIYGFRGASPELFTGYRAQFASGQAQGKGRTIFLSDNFRCDAPVIDFSNLIFSVLFTRGNMPYTDEDALKCSKPAEGEGQQTRITLAVIPTEKEEDDGETDSDGNPETDRTAEHEKNPDNADAYTEADYTADAIAHLLSSGRKRDGTPIRPRDIAILVRSAKSSAAPIAKALESRGIPSYNSVSRAFFENAEVLLMFSLLSVIDNPARDVYLAGVLKSPLFRVTLDELVYLRRQYPHGSLYDALCGFTEETGYAKGTYFLEKLAHYRRRAEGMPVDRFLWYLYQDTGILSLVYERERHELFDSPDDNAPSAQMRANLMMFYEYARAFESGSFQGLYQFVLFIGNIIDEKQQMPPVLLSGDDADAVRIMTVHQSKGLEFPVCFVCGCGKKFNDSDTRASVLLDRGAGIATYLRDETGFARINHPARECVRRAIRDAAREEEKRILYVALTRAREQLYLCAAAKEPQKLFDEMHLLTEKDVTAQSLSDAGNVLVWLFTALSVTGEHGAAVCDVQFPTQNPFAETVSDAPAVDAPRLTLETKETGGLSLYAVKRKIDAALSFVYPDAVETTLPSKLSVSELHRMRTEAAKVANTEENPDTDLSDTGESAAETAPEQRYAIPRFLQNPENDAPTPAERGTATHEFMQFCDYNALADIAYPPRERIAREIERLTRGQFITEETAARIDRKTLGTFLSSTLFAKLGRAAEIRREVRFNLYVPARAVPTHDLPGRETAGDARILMQGIVDCYYTDERGRVILIDYKTDHFRRDQLAEPAKVEAILRARHGEQMSYYCEAVEQLLCRPVYDVRIYSFALGYDFSVL